MHLISWNVNGLRAALKKDFARWFASSSADVICLQETKARAEQITEDFAEGWHAHWNSATKPGYSGVVTFSRSKPLAVHHGIGSEDHDSEGRVLTLEFPECFVVNCYTPNSQNELRRLPYRQLWDDAFRDFLLALNQQKPVLLGGDLNVAHQEIDIARPKANHHSPGFTDQERQSFQQHLDAGLIDSFRHLHPGTTEAYSWWSMRSGARARNIGWRIDYWLTSARLAEQIKRAEIHPEVLGSDHCPVSIELNW